MKATIVCFLQENRVTGVLNFPMHCHMFQRDHPITMNGATDLGLGCPRNAERGRAETYLDASTAATTILKKI